MRENINTKEYWEARFASGNWDEREGQIQTYGHATSNLALMKPRLPKGFSGTLLDFGCAKGNAIRAYSEAYPEATLLGMDISKTSIEACRESFGKQAEFFIGDHMDVPEVDVIVVSHVLEHLDDDIGIARQLLSKCKHLFIFVPWRERLGDVVEHVHSYGPDGFHEVAKPEVVVFFSQGNVLSGKELWINIYLKNLFRPLLGRRLVYRRKTVMYHLQSD